MEALAISNNLTLSSTTEIADVITDLIDRVELFDDTLESSSLYQFEATPHTPLTRILK